MSHPRFFCPMPLSTGQTVVLPDHAAAHAGRSLRLRQGDLIILFNGQGGHYEARLHFEQGQAQADILSHEPQDFLPAAHIELIQALPQGDKMDWIIEKSSELGLRALTPLKAARSIVQLDAKRLPKRMQRWQKISIAAAEQCGRNRPLTIHEPLDCKDVPDRFAEHFLILCEPQAPLHLAEVIRQGLAAGTLNARSRFALLIGPEGGWAEPELAQLSPCTHAARWGELVLRTETAGLVVGTSLINYLQEC